MEPDLYSLTATTHCCTNRPLVYCILYVVLNLKMNMRKRHAFFKRFDCVLDKKGVHHGTFQSPERSETSHVLNNFIGELKVLLRGYF